MRDLHNHLLFGIDDGSTTIEESKALLKEMEESKVTDIMLTPHYITGSNYICNNNVYFNWWNIIHNVNKKKK